jgi:RND family efflux transporter MFP subunit
MKKMRINVFLKVLPLLGLFFVTGCVTQVENEENAPMVFVTKISGIDTVEKHQFNGIVRENDEVKLSFRIAGPIAQIPVKEGQLVKKGEVLALIDSRDYELNYNAVKAEYEQVISEVARLEELYKKGNVPDNDYEKAVSGRKQMEVKFNAAKNALNDTRLTAPFSGIVQTLFMSENEMVDTGTLIVSLIDVNSLIIETDIPDNIYLKREAFSGFSFSTRNAPDDEMPLEMRGIAAKASRNNLYRARLTYRPADGSFLAPGMSVTVNLMVHADASSGIRVPGNAVFSENNSAYVWKYHQDGLHKTKIATGVLNRENNIPVFSGLQPGDTIVVAGVHALKEGQCVKPVFR